MMKRFMMSVLAAIIARNTIAGDPIALWNANFNQTNEFGKITLENGYSLSVNGNDVSPAGDEITIGTNGVLLDWNWSSDKTDITLLVNCTKLPVSTSQCAILSLWDEYSDSDLVGVCTTKDGTTSGIWESGKWTATTGKGLPGDSCVLAFRYNKGSGYVGNPYGGTALFAVTNNVVDEIYFDVILKRNHCKCDGATIGGCRTSTLMNVLSGMQISGVALYHEYMSEDEILAASKVFDDTPFPCDKVATPTVLLSAPFVSVSQEVSLSCDTEDATIYYTIDGSEPSATNGRRYKGPFDIYQTTTVKAIAVKDDWMDSAVASATFTKANEIGPAINMLEVLPDNDKTHPWTVVSDVTHDGVSAVKSGEIEDEESTTLKVTVYGAGQLSFWWKTSCEPSIGGEYYDYATFYNGSTAITNLAGVTDWQQVWLDVAGTGKHTFKWTYQKDDSGSTVPDGMWLDQVQWLPATTDYYSDHTLTTETPVKYNWLRKYGLGVTTDFESAAKAKSGKYDGAGRELTVEQEYIAGTDPTNETSHLTSSIEMVDGLPVITWKPDLNEGGAKDERAYKIWGSTNLVNGGEWEWPTNALHRFFKVTVEMP